jgi:hypothetical protein
MQAVSYQNGIHRELRQGQFGPYWSMVTNSETAHMWPTMGHDSGREEEMPEKFAPSVAVCRQLEDGFNVAIGDYQPWFPRALDRDIFEHTPYGLSFPAWPHEQAATCPRHLTLKWVSDKAQCKPFEAAELADTLSILEAPEKVALEVCRWARARGIPATVNYLYRFCLAVAEVEQVPEEDALASRAEPVPETMAYHRIGGNEEARDWLESSPLWFQKLISTVKECNDIEVLKALSTQVYNNLRGDYKGVFLGYYKARKHHLEKKAGKHLCPTARGYTARINKAKNKKELGSFGIYLHKAQKGQVKAPELKPVEWTLVWSAYHAKKANFDK